MNRLSEDIKDNIIKRYFEYGTRRGAMRAISKELGIGERTISYFINKSLK